MTLCKRQQEALPHLSLGQPLAAAAVGAGAAAAVAAAAQAAVVVAAAAAIATAAAAAAAAAAQAATMAVLMRRALGDREGSALRCHPSQSTPECSPLPLP